MISLLNIALLAFGMAFAESTDTKKQEMQEMKRIHLRCMNSHKSSANCHQDMMKACDLSREECLKMMGRMNMDEVIKARKDK